MRGETQSRICCSLHFWYFNPLSPCGERRQDHVVDLTKMVFQSTLPMRGETHLQRYRQNWERFQSTLPMRGETPCVKVCLPPCLISIHSPHAGRDRVDRHCIDREVISIHSPHAGRDLPQCLSLSLCTDFNPLSPCGERRFATIRSNFSPLFQSTLPMRGETKTCISSSADGTDFNPLSPCGERPETSLTSPDASNFNPLSPCGERPGQWS